MERYLKHTDIIDWQHPTVLDLAKELSAEKKDVKAVAGACFEWVKDRIFHSYDYRMNPLTCRASEVLFAKTGYCFAKSHLLAALLRANFIPAGFCYQRLSFYDNGEPFSLHGFNAVYLPEIGWYRVDARGNKKGINARFDPPQEYLAYSIRLPGEFDCPKIFSDPLPIVIESILARTTWNQFLENLPDIPSEKLMLI